MNRDAAGGPPEHPHPSPPPWEALALLAVTTAILQAMSPPRRRRARKRLANTLSAWEREDPDQGAAEAALRLAAQRFLRPLLAHLESGER